MMRPSCDSRRSRHKPSRVAPAGRAPPASPWPYRGSAKIQEFPVVFVPLPLLAPLIVNTAVICVNGSLIQIINNHALHGQDGLHKQAQRSRLAGDLVPQTGFEPVTPSLRMMLSAYLPVSLWRTQPHQSPFLLHLVSSTLLRLESKWSLGGR